MSNNVVSLAQSICFYLFFRDAYLIDPFWYRWPCPRWFGLV